MKKRLSSALLLAILPFLSACYPVPSRSPQMFLNGDKQKCIRYFNLDNKRDEAMCVGRPAPSCRSCTTNYVVVGFMLRNHPKYGLILYYINRDMSTPPHIMTTTMEAKSVASTSP